MLYTSILATLVRGIEAPKQRPDDIHMCVFLLANDVKKAQDFDLYIHSGNGILIHYSLDSSMLYLYHTSAIHSNAHMNKAINTANSER